MHGVWKRLIVAAALASAALGASAQALEIEGVKLDPTAQVGGTVLQLNGAGLRTRVVFKVYVAGLYVPAKANSAAALLAQKGPRRVAITMLRSVDANDFAGALNEGLQKNSSEAQLTAMKAQVEAFIAAIKANGEAKKGDMIFIDYVPDAGTRVLVNGKVQGNPIAGEEFYGALLRIWLGDKPADNDLKKGMVGA